MLGQACGVGNVSKTVALLDKVNAGLAGLAGHVFMTIQDHLGRKRRMPADLDGHMPPVGVEKMKRVMIDVGHRFLPLQMMPGPSLPNRSLGPADQDQKQAPSDLGLFQLLFSDLMLAVPHRAIEDGNLVRLCPAAYATTEATRHPHQMGVVESLIRTGQALPPEPKPAWGMPQTKVGIQD